MGRIVGIRIVEDLELSWIVCVRMRKRMRGEHENTSSSEPVGRSIRTDDLSGEGKRKRVS
jgi:hypothetical protein